VHAGIGERPAAVVLLHGGTQSPRTTFGPTAGATPARPGLAAEVGCVLLVPNGVNATIGDTSGDDQNWNDGRSDAGAAGTTADDVGFICNSARGPRLRSA
jgi:poly(3-hydroxybutyrate) depolymerase